MSVHLDPKYPNPFAAPPEGFFNKFFMVYFEKLRDDHLAPGAYCDKVWKQQNGSTKVDTVFMQKCVEQCVAERRFEHWSRFY